MYHTGPSDDFHEYVGEETVQLPPLIEPPSSYA
jgi:hypothetical protein